MAGSSSLRIGAGARPAALSGAYVAVADDVSSIYWNPAGMSLIKKNQIGAMHGIWLEGISYECLGYVHKLRNNKSLGVMINMLSANDTRRLSKQESNAGEFGIKDIAVSAGYSQKIQNLVLIGINTKFINQSIDQYSGRTFALDIGCIIMTTRYSRIGFTVQNIGKNITIIDQSSPLPLTIRVGNSVYLFKNKLLIATDGEFIIDGTEKLNLGLEYNIKEIVNLRGGYQISRAKSISQEYSAGMGIKYKRLILDYAWVPYGGLGTTHRISIQYGY